MRHVILTKKKVMAATNIPKIKKAKAFGYVSRAVRTFKKKFLLKYGLLDYQGAKGEPLVMFGLYYPEDYSLYKKHKGKITVVWCGGDSRGLNHAKALVIKSRPAKHIAMGKFISTSLKTYDIPHEILPVCPTMMKKCPIPRGDKLYFYGKPGLVLYREKHLPEIGRRTGIKIIKTHSAMHSFDELKKLYAQCFLGLRLTPHDGLPNTVIELGLMGRRSIYNGGTPHSIPWTSIDDVCKIIMKEYEMRAEDNTAIADDWEKYLNIKDNWIWI